MRPCNGLDETNEENNMGNLNLQSFKEIWHSEKAKRIREMVKNCPKNCWMIGTASPAIKKNLFKVLVWVVKK
ncbi:MAG: SPASM domain-containing protein [Candidatus Aenigmatarchaeota archaeon]